MSSIKLSLIWAPGNKGQELPTGVDEITAALSQVLDQVTVNPDTDIYIETNLNLTFLPTPVAGVFNIRSTANPGAGYVVRLAGHPRVKIQDMATTGRRRYDSWVVVVGNPDQSPQLNQRVRLSLDAHDTANEPTAVFGVISGARTADAACEVVSLANRVWKSVRPTRTTPVANTAAGAAPGTYWNIAGKLFLPGTGVHAGEIQVIDEASGIASYTTLAKISEINAAMNSMVESLSATPAVNA